MLTLIFLVLLGFLMAFFATENTLPVNLTIAGNILTGVPLFVIVMASLLLGIVISWLIHLINTISSEITLMGKETELKTAINTIEALRKKNRELEVATAELKNEVKETEIKAYENLKKNKRPSVADRIKHSLFRRHSFS